MKSRYQRPQWALSLFFLMVITFLYVPLFYIVIQTFLVNPYEWTSGFTLNWIIKLYNEPDLWEPLLTSIEIAVFAASLSVVMGTLGAIGLNKSRTLLPQIFQNFIMLPILLPEVITGLSLLLFFLVLRIELGMFTIVLAHASFSASFVYFIMVEQLCKLDPQLTEAAEDLGAKPSIIFWKITFPNIIPGMIAGWLLAFTISFDDFLISFFTSGSGVTTLPLKIYSLLRIGITPEINGLAFIMISFSTLLIIVLFSREQSRSWVVKGS